MTTSSSPPVLLVGHNLAEDLALLWEAGIIPPLEAYARGDAVLDTLILARLVREDRPSFRLEDLLAEEGEPIEGWKARTAGRPVSEWSAEERRDRCARDAEAAWRLARRELPRLRAQPRGVLNLRAWTRVAMVLQRLSLAGMMLDRVALDALRARTRATREAALARLRTRTGQPEFSPRRSAAVREWLYTTLGLPVLARTETGLPAVTRSVLQALAEDTEGETRAALQDLIAWGEAEKLWTTYVEGLQARAWVVAPDRAWLPGHLTVLGARTGRRTSGEGINVQNWPPEVRRLVVSRWPGGAILAADYRSLEPVILAWLAQSEALLEAFTTGGGYRTIARTLLGVEVAEGSTEYRGIKAIVLGVHYGADAERTTAPNLWRQGIRFSTDPRAHAARTRALQDQYLRAYPEVAAYMTRQANALRRGQGMIVLPSGRRMHLDAAGGTHARNQAINGPIQGTAAEVTAAALWDLETAILREVGLSRAAWLSTLLAERRRARDARRSGQPLTPPADRTPRLINEVHDELVLDLPEATPRWIELVTETMRAVPSLRRWVPVLAGIPLRVKVVVGPRWGEAAG